MKEPAASVTSRLADLVGTEHVVTGPLNLSAYAVDGLEPSVVLLPGSAAEVVEVLRFAAVERLTVIPIGGRTKLSIGMPPRSYDLALDMSRMNRILAYDPRDLTLGVEPGVRFTELDARLAKQRQFLPLAPPFADRATLGGIIAAGCDSLLRHTYGSVRDYLLGMEFRHRGSNGLEERRARGEKRRRLRSAQAAGGFAGHSGGHHANQLPHISPRRRNSRPS